MGIFFYPFVLTYISLTGDVFSATHCYVFETNSFFLFICTFYSPLGTKKGTLSVAKAIHAHPNSSFYKQCVNCLWIRMCEYYKGESRNFLFFFFYLSLSRFYNRFWFGSSGSDQKFCFICHIQRRHINSLFSLFSFSVKTKRATKWNVSQKPMNHVLHIRNFSLTLY